MSTPTAVAGLVASHVHIDKTLWGLPGGRTAPPSLKNSHRQRAPRVGEINVPLRSGPAGCSRTACPRLPRIRSHIDVDPEIGLRHVESLLALREAYRDVVAMQFVVFPQTGMLIQPGTVELMERALRWASRPSAASIRRGSTTIPIRHLEAIFNLAGHSVAAAASLSISMTADERRKSGVIERDRRFHAGPRALRRQGDDQPRLLPRHGPEGCWIEALGRRLAELRISLMTTAPADCSLPPVAFLKALGVNICCGSDGIRDAWSPFGNGDMLERAMLLAQRFDWRKRTKIWPPPSTAPRPREPGAQAAATVWHLAMPRISSCCRPRPERRAGASAAPARGEPREGHRPRRGRLLNRAQE